MSSQSIVLWNYIIYFHIRGCFSKNFLHWFWKKVHNSKEIVNIQCLFVWTVGNIDMTTSLITKHYYIIGKVYFYIIYRYIVIFPVFIYSITEVCERLPPCQYKYFPLYYVLYYSHDEETLNSFMPRSYLRYKKGPDLNLTLPT